MYIFFAICRSTTRYTYTDLPTYKVLCICINTRATICGLSNVKRKGDWTRGEGGGDKRNCMAQFMYIRGRKILGFRIGRNEPASSISGLYLAARFPASARRVHRSTSHNVTYTHYIHTEQRFFLSRFRYYIYPLLIYLNRS